MEERTRQISSQTLRVGAAELGRHVTELRWRRPLQPLTDSWEHLPIAPRGSTLLGISYRTPQVETLGLDARATLRELLAYPFQLIRLGAYWMRSETAPDIFSFDELDWQVDAAEQAGKQIILCVGPLKTFSYPEFFVPEHRLRHPLPEHTLIRPDAHAALLEAASAFMMRVVERYRARKAIVAWQLEHEAVDPLGVEHSWRLAFDFVAREVEALRAADPGRPIMMNGFLPTSLLVGLSQWWRTRDQGDSLAVAQRLADIVGIDYYPRHALLPLGGRTLYLDGGQSLWLRRRRKRLFSSLRSRRQRLMIAEGQAEPWESVTTAPNPRGQGMYSCLPEQVIINYNTCLGWSRPALPLYAYLFWGAEYWMLRQRSADASYLQAFARILERS
ncbi:hypothetical protein KDH_72300 [Dictyobacter sp. S3.2.2.5]|uniref:Glycoside hydrolase family 42 N-terminal domain-containing protein n=1 Tax=Dictyobacter halimunensis TaxID=3026934 RepID=A0ABQ6G6H4_9CHLR|nr:hypothetical protein KDH_72300 [Dictyobacter sp. S3.2.2.5]